MFSPKGRSILTAAVAVTAALAKFGVLPESISVGIEANADTMLIIGAAIWSFVAGRRAAG